MGARGDERPETVVFWRGQIVRRLRRPAFSPPNSPQVPHDAHDPASVYRYCSDEVLTSAEPAAAHTAQVQAAAAPGAPGRSQLGRADNSKGPRGPLGTPRDPLQKH